MSQTYDSVLASKKSPEFCLSGYQQFKVIDMHTCGEPLRVILSGVPELQGESILQMRSEMKEKYDFVRRLLMYEPRGHSDMYGCILVPPEREDSDFGILFMHNEGYSTMCGHAIIAITKLAADLGWKKPKDGIMALQIDAPCGRINSEYNVHDRSEFAIRFEGVPSFVLKENHDIYLDDFGNVRYDIAYGGAFYAYVDADALELDLTPGNIEQIIRIGKVLKRQIVQSKVEVTHPGEHDLGFLYGVIFRTKLGLSSTRYRNVCVFADGEVDRSPTGSGVCGFLALLRHKGLISSGTTISVESIISSKFQGTFASETKYYDYEAIIPNVAGNAFVTGIQNFCLDPNDPLQEGFLLR